MRVYRLVRPEHGKTAFSGEGAALVGGRWNHRSLRVVYTSSSVSLAVLEALVHVEQGGALPTMLLFTVDIPDSQAIGSVTTTDLPGFPAVNEHMTRDIGTEWLRSGRTVALVVPSAVVTLESNVLLNPSHPAFGNLVIGDPVLFTPDARLPR